MKWSVEIQKTGLEQRNLSDLLSGLGFQLIDGVDFKAMYAPSFDKLQTANEVWEEAKKVRSAFIGPASIDTEFRLGSVVDYSTEERKRHAFLEVESICSTESLGSVTLTVSPPKDLSIKELKKREEDRAEQEYQSKLERQREKLEPAFLENNAPKVLELLSKEIQTGESLYKTYELMEGHPSNRKVFQKQFNTPKNEFKRFSDAVHNSVVSGDFARHAYQDKPKTVDSMTIVEAGNFIRTLSKSWLVSIRKINMIKATP